MQFCAKVALRNIAVASVCTLLGVTARAQTLNITPLGSNTTSANALADSLLGSGVNRVGNASLVGANGQQGTFSTTGGGASGVIGFRNGILLTTGQAAVAVGPNDSDSAGVATGTGSAPEIPDGFDANVLEFQFSITPGLTDLRFSYVFASEEYPEYVGSVNDGFGLFINGTNVALVPAPAAPNTPVSINNISPSTNSQYYVDNTSSALNTQYDGLTTVLTTADVTPYLNGGTNTLRIVIADRYDEYLDSGVFIRANSFTQGGVGGTPVAPEPGAFALLGIGMFGLGVVRRRSR